MPATVATPPRKCLIAISEPITASHSLSVLRNTQRGRGMVSFTPSWVVPSQNTVRMRLSSSTGPRARETPEETMPWMTSTRSCSASRRARSVVSRGFVSSSTTSSTRRPATPPAALIFSTANSTPFSPTSPTVPATPARGAMIPTRSGRFCARAGSGSAAAAPPASSSVRRVVRIPVVPPLTPRSGAELGLVRPGIQRGHLPPHRVAVRGERRGVELRHRPRLQVVVATGVAAAHQRRRVPDLELPDGGRDVADRQPDPPVARGVRAGVVRQLHVVQRHLAGPERHLHRPLGVHLHRDLLAAGEQVVLVESVGV